MLPTRPLLLALATLCATLAVPASAHTGECRNLDEACLRDCTLRHLSVRGAHSCAVWSEADSPGVRYEQCRPPEFGYAVWVNGQQVAWCAT